MCPPLARLHKLPALDADYLGGAAAAGSAGAFFTVDAGASDECSSWIKIWLLFTCSGALVT